MTLPSATPFQFRASLRRPVRHAFLAGVATALVALALPNVYRSEARILPDTGHGGSPSALRTGIWAPSAPPETPSLREDGPTVVYADILRSRRLGEQLLLKDYAYACRSWHFGKERPVRGTLLQYLDVASLDRGMAALNRMLMVRRDAKSGLLTVSVDTRSPGLSLQVVQGATQGLREILVELSQAAGVAKARFTLGRLAEVQHRSGQLSAEFQAFQDANRNWETSPSPRIRFRGAQLKADVELWQQVVTNLTLTHEQALLEAQNDTQTLLLLDAGSLPVEKSKPARALLVLAAMVAAGAGSWVYLNRVMVHDRILAKEPAP